MTYEETEAEDADQAELLALAEVQTAQGREREDENNNVSDDVAGCVVVPEGDVGDAFARHLVVPELVDGRAREDDDEQLRDRPECDKDESGNDDPFHVPGPQDAVVLEEEGEFGCC